MSQATESPRGHRLEIGNPGRGGTRRQVNGVLHLYHRPVLRRDASTVMEHVESLGAHSRFPVWKFNTGFGFPRGLHELEFGAVVLHYSVFRVGAYYLDNDFRAFLADNCEHSYKIAIFQDECHFCQDRFSFLNEYGIDCVFSCLEQSYADQVYGRYTGVAEVVSCIPGYVSEELAELARRTAKHDRERHIDIGYRGRALPPWLGRGGQEKREVGVRFEDLARESGLRLDIGTSEEDRIYGDAWYRFIASCKAVLGTESGVSLVDLEDEVYAEYTRLREAGEEATIEQLEQGPLARWEGNIEYRTISPRHFEAAALGTCQILYEGRYSGAMEPMRHYIPLRKDFSNFDEVIERFRDEDLRNELVANAYHDLIASGEYGYDRFVRDLDRVLVGAGLKPEVSNADARRIRAALRSRRSLVRAHARHVAYNWHFPGRRMLLPVARPLVRGLRWLRSGDGVN